MRTLKRRVTVASLLALIFAIPIAAQLTNSVIFDTSFAFYAGNAKMPAGTYRISQSDPGTQLLLLENTSGSHSIFLEYTPTSSETPHPQTDVTFNKYGDREFITLIWVGGRSSGMKINESKYEQIAEKNGTATRHSVTAISR
jgi:hypothetical protein